MAYRQIISIIFNNIKVLFTIIVIDKIKICNCRKNIRVLNGREKRFPRKL